MVQQQLYATMPKYVIRLAGETAKPGWIANVNPFCGGMLLSALSLV